MGGRGEAWLVAGLGNPGDHYAETRHNVGAWALDRLAETLGLRLRKVRFMPVDAADAAVDGDRVHLVRTRSFMNRSGPPIAGFARKREVPVERIVVCHDEIDLPLGALKIKRGGSTAGHNGLNSLVSALHAADFVRVRMGVGRPRGRKDPADHVLEPFAKDEREEADLLAADAAEAALTVVREGLGAAQDRFNRGGAR
jgi:PTH1 family peptidyl-tRNA hydrolase